MRAPLVFDERTSPTAPSSTTEAPLRTLRRRLAGRTAAGNRIRRSGADHPRRPDRLSRLLHDPSLLLSKRLSLQLHELGRVRQLQGSVDGRSGFPRPLEIPAVRRDDQQPPLGDLLCRAVLDPRPRSCGVDGARALREVRQVADLRADGDCGNGRRGHLAARLQPRSAHRNGQRRPGWPRRESRFVARPGEHGQLRDHRRVRLGVHRLRDGRPLGSVERDPDRDHRSRSRRRASRWSCCPRR